MAGELDRETAERVLRRALQLSGGERSGLTIDQLVAIGSELGVEEGHVRHALAEVLSEEPTARRSLAPKTLRANRAIEQDASLLARLLEDWFETSDGMRVVRRPSPGHAVWEPRRGGIANARAALVRSAGHDLDLRSANVLTAHVEPVTDGVSVIRLEAEVDRSGAVTAGVVGVGGTVASSVAGVLVWWPYAGFSVIALSIASAVWEGHRRQLRRIQIALERRLDQVATGAPPPQPLASVTKMFGKLRPKKR